MLHKLSHDTKWWNIGVADQRQDEPVVQLRVDIDLVTRLRRQRLRVELLDRNLLM
jgi:hypothetical protein